MQAYERDDAAGDGLVKSNRRSVLRRGTGAPCSEPLEWQPVSYDFCFPRFPQSLNVDQARAQLLTGCEYRRRGMVNAGRASRPRRLQDGAGGQNPNAPTVKREAEEDWGR